MKNDLPKWTKNELKIYILLLCAKADWNETPEEISYIKSKTTPEIFERIKKEASEDNEDMCLDKIEAAIEGHRYSSLELIELKQEIQEVFFSDKEFTLKERYIDEILDNLIY